MRLFLGVELSPENKEAIASMLFPLKKSEKGWENTHDLHLTLLFIGACPEGLVESIKERVHKIHVPSFAVKSSTFHFFNRRIMYLGFEHSPEMLELRKKIEVIYPEYVREHEKEFVPHVTVKRWQRHEHADLVEGLEKSEQQSLVVPVKELCLFKSEKDSENRKYHVIHRTRL
ncbi:MAG: RNA 2',3'-cyclic phosphodiesterase [Bacteriovoracaceae bacterium]